MEYCKLMHNNKTLSSTESSAYLLPVNKHMQMTALLKLCCQILPAMSYGAASNAFSIILKTKEGFLEIYVRMGPRLAVSNA